MNLFYFANEGFSFSRRRRELTSLSVPIFRNYMRSVRHFLFLRLQQEEGKLEICLNGSISESLNYALIFFCSYSRYSLKDVEKMEEGDGTRQRTVDLIRILKRRWFQPRQLLLQM